MNVVDAVRRANRPGPAEHSVALRVGAAGAVVVGIVACGTQGELSSWFTAVAAALVVAGNVFSYRRRHRPLPYVKLLLAAAMVGAFAWFFTTVSAAASTGTLGSVEGPLATLFTAMQAAHAFDVPSRRDLGFSLAGSATLVAVAAAQAIDAEFGLLVLAWGAFVVTGLVATWGSMSGAPAVRWGSVAGAVAGAVVIGVVVLAVVPAPRPASGLVDPAGYDGGPTPAQPSKLVHGGAPSTGTAASASGPTGVGGFLGFAGPLDTAVRGSLGDEVVLRVRADRPTYWIAETFDSWSGQSWTESAPAPGRGAQWQALDSGPPFVVPSGAASGALSAPRPDGPADAGAPGTVDYQTFYLAVGGSDLVLHASQASAVWFPTRRIFVAADGTIEAGTSLGPGSVYTVLSSVQTPTAAQLGATSGTAGLTSTVRRQDLQLPHAYPRVARLARRITAGKTTTYAKIVALEDWIGAHTKYTTDIPPLGPGQDTVDQFLFVTHRGYCEQISTSLAVMLRSLGIAAREATGYVPGPYDPLTDLYEVQAKDAHAWVQVWFPGYGWESFDPTAYVPLANPSPADAIGHDLLAAAHDVPVVPTVPVGAALVCLAAALAVVRRRPATWRAAITRHLERAARRAGVDTGEAETLRALAGRLDDTLGRSPPELGLRAAADVAAAAELSAWSGHDPSPAAVHALVRDARRIRRTAARRRGRRRPGAPSGGPSGGPKEPRNEARGRPEGATAGLEPPAWTEV